MRQLRKALKLALGLTLGVTLGSERGAAQQAAAREPALPAGLVMPMRLLGIDAEESGKARVALQHSIVELAATWLQAP